MLPLLLRRTIRPDRCSGKLRASIVCLIEGVLIERPFQIFAACGSYREELRELGIEENV
jgi:hypothetical protein